MRVLRNATVLCVIACAVLAFGAMAPASAVSTATLQSEQQGPEGYQQGVARIDDGWIFTGTGEACSD